MITLLAFNALMVLLGAAIASRVLPARWFRGILAGLRATVGITTPAPEKERVVALIWVATLTVTVDGMLFLLVFLARSILR